MWHPAALLITWLGFALLLQWAAFAWLLVAAGAALAAAFALAPRRCRRLLGRSRWLLASLFALFLFFTPGEYLSSPWGELGVTREGLRHAVEQLARLLAMLASLALLHERLGTSGLLAGLYALLTPFAWRERTVVRLMLVLEAVENTPRADWRSWLAPEEEAGEATRRVLLPVVGFRGRDIVLVVAVVALVVAVATHR